MARKATVDKEMTLQMLREGKSTHIVAEHFGVSRQAIDLYRKEFIQRGLLVDRRSPRQMTTFQKGEETKPEGYSAVAPDHEARTESHATDLPLDQLIDLVITAFNSLKRIPELEAELEKYKRNYQKAAEQIELLSNEVKKRKEQESRWLRATQPGETVRHTNDDK